MSIFTTRARRHDGLFTSNAEVFNAMTIGFRAFSTRPVRRGCSVAGVIGVALLASGAAGDTFIWTGLGVPGVWNDPANWQNTTPGGAPGFPGLDDRVVVDSSFAAINGGVGELEINEGVEYELSGAPEGALDLAAGGSITNRGVVRIGGAGAASGEPGWLELRLDTSADLSGDGELILGGAGAVVSGGAGDHTVLHQHAGHTIRGHGMLEELSLVNAGMLRAEGGTLVLRDTTLQGVGEGFVVDGNATLRLEESSMIDLAGGVLGVKQGATLSGEGVLDALISGGTIELAEGVRFRDVVAVRDVVIQGDIELDDADEGALYFTGDVVQHGTLRIGGGGAAGLLGLHEASEIRLGGVGDIVLGGNGSVITSSNSVGRTLSLSDGRALRGAGELRRVHLITPGSIDVHGGALELRYASIEGNGAGRITIASDGELRGIGSIPFSGPSQWISRVSILGEEGARLNQLRFEDVELDGSFEVTQHIEMHEALRNDSSLTLRGWTTFHTTPKSSPFVLDGSGEIVLAAENASIRGFGDGVVHGAGHTIRGFGSIDQFSGGLKNHGSIIAQGGLLEVWARIRNEMGSEVRVASGARLGGQGSIQGGTIEIDPGGALDGRLTLRDLEVRGVLRTDDTTRLVNSTLRDGAVIDGGDRHVTLRISGDIVNNETIDVFNGIVSSYSADIPSMGTIRYGALTGSGTLRLNGPDSFVGAGSTVLRNEAGHTIRGNGRIGGLLNRGSVIAEGGVLEVDNLRNEGAGSVFIASDGVLSGELEGVTLRSAPGGVIRDIWLRDTTLTNDFTAHIEDDGELHRVSLEGDIVNDYRLSVVGQSVVGQGSGAELLGRGVIAIEDPDAGLAGRFRVGADFSITGIGRMSSVDIVNSGELTTRAGEYTMSGISRISNQASGRLTLGEDSRLDGRDSALIIGGVVHGGFGSSITSASLQNLALEGELTLASGSGEVRISDRITNQGDVFLGAPGAVDEHRLITGFFAEFDGAGTLHMRDGSVLGAQSISVRSTLNNMGSHTISGHGVVRDLELDQYGAIEVSGGELSFENTTLRTYEGSTLSIAGDGAIRTDGIQFLSNTTLSSASGGRMLGTWAIFDSVMEGALEFGGDAPASLLLLPNTTNNAVVTLVGNGLDDAIPIDSSLSIAPGAAPGVLSGSGAIVLTGDETGIVGGSGASLINGSQHTISGAGVVDLGDFDNLGSVLADGGALEFTGGFRNNGRLGGEGEVSAAAIDQHGVITPGAGVGSLVINGDVASSAGSALEIDVVSADLHDTLSVSGLFEFGGTLRVSFGPDAGEFEPDATLTIVDAGALGAGMFDRVRGLGGYRFDVNYDRVLGTVSLTNIREIPAAPTGVGVAALFVSFVGRRRSASSANNST